MKQLEELVDLVQPANNSDFIYFARTDNEVKWAKEFLGGVKIIKLPTVKDVTKRGE